MNTLNEIAGVILAFFLGFWLLHALNGTGTAYIQSFWGVAGNTQPIVDAATNAANQVGIYVTDAQIAAVGSSAANNVGNNAVAGSTSGAIGGGLVRNPISHTIQ